MAASRFSDPDGDELHFTATSSGTAVVTTTGSEDEILLSAEAQGAARVELTARDPGGLAATLDFTVTVTEASGVNRAPVVVGAVAARRLNEDDSTTFNAAPYFRDPDNDRLTFTTASSDTDVVAVTVSGSEVMLWAVAPGAAAIEITARDSSVWPQPRLLMWRCSNRELPHPSATALRLSETRCSKSWEQMTARK